MKFRILAKTILATAVMSANSVAMEVDPEVKQRIESILGKGGSALTYFHGPGKMIGVGVQSLNGRELVVYSSEDGKYIFSGVAIDVARGVNLANEDLTKLPEPSYDGLVEKVSTLSNQAEGYTVTYGDKASSNQYYVFIDPNCPYCHTVMASFEALKNEGRQFSVHYVPVGILSPESENISKSMGAIENDVAYTALTDIAKSKAYKPTADSVKEGTKSYEGNIAMFRSLQFKSVPVVISDVNGVKGVNMGAVPIEQLRQQLDGLTVEPVASR